MGRVLAWITLFGLFALVCLLAGCSGNSGTNAQPSTGQYTITFNQTQLQLTPGQQIQMTPCILCNGQTVSNPSITWSANSQIGTISSTGLFTAVSNVAAGTPVQGKITATAYGISASVNVTVSQTVMLSSIQIGKPQGVDLTNVLVGTNLAFTASGKDSGGNTVGVTVNWSVTGSIGTIDANGNFHATTAGTGTVVATDGSLTAHVAVTVVNPPVTPTPSLKILVPAGVNMTNLLVGDKVALTASLIDAHGNASTPASLTWKVTGTGATISTTGLLTAQSIGTGTVTATSGTLTNQVAFAVVPPFIGTIAFVNAGVLQTNICTVTSDGAIANVTTGKNKYCAPNWSSANGKIVFVSTSGSFVGLCTVNNSGQVTNLNSCQAQNPVWSPDGTKIAYTNGSVASGDIMVVDAQGNFIRQLTFGLLGNPSYPSWSPDGTQFAFYLQTSGGLNGGLYYAASNGTGTCPSCLYSGQVTDVAWSPNPRVIAFSDSHNIYQINATGGVPQTLVQETGTLAGGFCWSPDGNCLAYGVQANSSASVQLRVYNLTTQRTVTITNLSGASAMCPTWMN